MWICSIVVAESEEDALQQCGCDKKYADIEIVDLTKKQVIYEDYNTDL